VNLNHLFDLSFVTRRDTVALEFEDRCFTFGELDARAKRLANLLAHRGLNAGDRLCVYLANCVEMIDLYLACVKLRHLRAHQRPVPRPRIAHILHDAEPSAVVSTPLRFPFPIWRPAELTTEATLPSPSDSPSAPTSRSMATPLRASSIRPAPRRVQRRHPHAQQLRRQRHQPAGLAGRLPPTVSCSPSPSSHVHGLGNGLHCWLAAGGARLRLLERFDHRQAAAAFLDFRPTLFFGVPTLYVRLLDLPRTWRAKSAPSCACSFPDRRPCPRTSWRSSAPASAIPS
jgi:acyl-CoA synthetase (AMP-forming)/AMP-acid ligase II